MGGKEFMSHPPLMHEGLLAVCGFWVRENHFSLRVQPLIGSRAPVDYLRHLHAQATLIGLSFNKEKKDLKLDVREKMEGLPGRI